MTITARQGKRTVKVTQVKVTQVSRVDSKSSIFGMVIGWPLEGDHQVVSVQFGN